LARAGLRSAKISCEATRLSPPIRQHNNAGSNQDKDNDNRKRLHRGQSLVAAVPKFQHAASIESTPGTVKNPLAKGRASAGKNAMLRLVARVLIARQHGLCRAGVEGYYHSDARVRKGGLSMWPRSIAS
jgi:hypothetical protein